MSEVIRLAEFPLIPGVGGAIILTLLVILTIRAFVNNRHERPNRRWSWTDRTNFVLFLAAIFLFLIWLGVLFPSVEVPRE